MSLDLDLIYSQFNFKVDKSDKSKIYEFGEFRLDAVHLMLYQKDEEIPLVPKAVETLLALVEKRGEILSKDELMKTIWTDSIVEESNLAQYLHLLRKILGETKDGKPFIETFRRRGYRFNGEVSVADFSAEIKQENTNQNFVPHPALTNGGAIRETTSGKVVALADWRHAPEVDEKSPQKVLPTAQLEEFPSESETQNAELSTGEIKSRKRGFAVGLILLLLASIGVSYWFFPNRPSNAAIESIAVLPFWNDSVETEYLSNGMTETLISSLSQLPNLNVKAQSVVFRYKGKDMDAQTIGKELNVQTILTGRVASHGDDLTLSLSFEDVETGNQIWGKQYNRQLSGIIALQTEIARDVSANLKTKLSGADEQRVAKTYTENVEAYQFYLRGNFYQSKGTPESLQKAIEYFQQAIALDPNFALAYVGLASSYAPLAHFNNVAARDLMLKAKAATLNALSLDDQLLEARIAFGSILYKDEYDFAGAEREFKRAVEQNPNDSDAHQAYGELLMCFGRHEESLAELRRALAIDPVSSSANWKYSISLFFARRYDEAVAQSKKTLELDDTYWWAHRGIAFSYQMKRDYAGSVAARAKMNEKVAPQTAALMRESFAKGGWQGFLRAMTGKQRPPNLPPYIVATFHVELGEKDKALSILNQMYEDRASDLTQLKVDPRLDPLRDDPRFVDLMRRMNFE